MKNQHSIYMALIMVVSLFNCNSSEAEEEFDLDPPITRTQADVIADFQNLDVKPGINDFSLETSTEGVFWNFRVIAPSNASPTNKRPLVIHLHGGSGQSSPDAHKSTACYVEPGVEALDAFIISPNAGAGEWYNLENHEQVLTLTDFAKDYWDVDDTKVLVTGFSNGGNASWYFADYYPQYFTAAIALSSSYNAQRSDGSLPALQIPLYVIHSSGDEIFPIANTEILVQRAIDAGSIVEYVALEGLSHFTPCDIGYVNALKDAVNWVVNEVW